MTLFDYFLTNGIVCDYNDFIKMLNYTYSSKSILSVYKNNINRNIKSNKYFENADLKKINIIFDKFRIYNDINLFCYELIHFKHNIKYRIEHLNKMNNSNKINNINKLNHSKSNTYLNPLNDLDLKKNIINRNINYYTVGSNTSNDLKNQLDILYYGKYINNNLPSLGVISNKFSATTPISISSLKMYKSFCDFFANFFKDYINTPAEKPTFVINLPISELKIEETISDILVNETKNINNINKIKDIVKGSIDKIKNINLGNILKIDNKKDIIKDKYIIPYIIDKSNNIEYIKKKSDIKTHFKIENSYKSSFKLIYNYIDANIKKPKSSIYFDKLLALFLYLQIELYYDLYKLYIRRLTDTLIKLSTSSDPNLNKLNYKDATIYVNNLDVSLLKFKKILLNNFYNLFVPTKIDNNYGIILNVDTGVNEIDPGADLIGNKIAEEYPLFNSNTLLPFIINFKKYDIYDKTSSLEIGTLCYNNKYFSYAINIYKNYLHKYSYIDESNLHVINYIKKYFEKCVIIEQLKKITDKKSYLLKENLDSEQKVNLENILFTFFKDNFEKSSKSLLSGSSYNKFSINKEIELFKSKIYYNISKITFKIIEHVLANIELKNKLLRKCTILEENYTKIISKKIKNTNKK
jgi:hypothetical protein